MHRWPPSAPEAHWITELFAPPFYTWTHRAFFLALFGSAILICLVCAGLILHKFIQRRWARWSAKRGGSQILNCWYCAKDQLVPNALSHSWKCHNCDSTNLGFNQEGDYETEPSEMYDETLNTDKCLPREIVNPGASYFSPSRSTHSPAEILCGVCSDNQVLWLQQTRSFTPRNEARYEEELAELKNHLARYYALCGRCDALVKEELNRKHKVLDQLWFGNKLSRTSRTAISKVPTRALLYRYASVCTGAYRFCVALLLICIFYEQINSDEKGPLASLIEDLWPSQKLLPYLAMSFLPLSLFMLLLKPKSANHLNIIRDLFILFTEFFLCLLQCVPLLHMKSEVISAEYFYSRLSLITIILALALRFSFTQPLFAACFFSKYQPGPVSTPLNKQSRTQTNTHPSDMSYTTTTASSSSSSSSSVAAASEQYPTFVPVRAFAAPDYATSSANQQQLGVERLLASIHLSE